MAKLNTPLLSLNAQGTLANAWTYRKRSRQNAALAIPTHPDANTRLQYYQRVRYRDAIGYWESLLPIQIADYQYQGSRQHRTAYQMAISDGLLLLPDLELWLPCDIEQFGLSPDLGLNDNHATPIGATLVLGRYWNAYFFDGADDRLSIPIEGIKDIALAITVSAWVCPVKLNLYQAILARNWGDPWYFRLSNINRLTFYFNTTGGMKGAVSTLTIPQTDTWHFVSASYDSETGILTFSLDGDFTTHQIAGNPLILAKTTTLWAGQYANLVQSWNGLIEEVRIFSRALGQDHLIALSRIPPNKTPSL